MVWQSLYFNSIFNDIDPDTVLAMLSLTLGTVHLGPSFVPLFGLLRSVQREQEQQPSGCGEFFVRVAPVPRQRNLAQVDLDSSLQQNHLLFIQHGIFLKKYPPYNFYL